MTKTGDIPQDLSRQADLIRTGQISPVELTAAYLERIETQQPKLNAFITVTAEQALQSARRCEAEIARGQYRGPLHGIPISYKDIISTAGIRTTAGSKILGSHVPTQDAVVVCRLREAGAISLGKTNLHEFAFGTTSNNAHFGPVHNPWDPAYIPGGSSGGSATAVVAGLSAASIGTDTGGSIRIPASACGCVGLKPTYGLVAIRGVIPLSWSLDHVGPITRSVLDAALVLDALGERQHPTGMSLAERLRKETPRVRLGVCPSPLLTRIHPEVEQAFQRAVTLLETRFGPARQVVWPSLQHGEITGTVIAFAEASAYHETWIRTRPQDYSSELLTRLRMGMFIPATDYLRCQRLRRKIIDEAEQLYRQVDLLVYPTLPFVGARIGAETVDVGGIPEDVRTASLRLNRPANLTGYPAISVPCGFSAAGMPIGFQLMAPPHQEELLLQVAQIYESESAELGRPLPH